MGQKVHPLGLRLKIVRDWTSRWYMNSKNFAKTLNQDIQARQYILKKLPNAGIGHIHIERPASNAKIIIYTSRPGVIIGKKGKDVEDLKKGLSKMMNVPIHITIEEIRKPELDATLVAENIAQQLEKRVMFRRAMKRAVTNAMRMKAKGIKVKVSGRLGGAEIARTEGYHEGRVPLHTLRADIDYGTAEAHTTYGVIGVKVWIFKGEVFDEPKPKLLATEENAVEAE